MFGVFFWGGGGGQPRYGKRSRTKSIPSRTQSCLIAAALGRLNRAVAGRVFFGVGWWVGLGCVGVGWGALRVFLSVCEIGGLCIGREGLLLFQSHLDLRHV